jgi:hypothetical protein
MASLLFAEQSLAYAAGAGVYREKSAQGTWNHSQIRDDKNVSHHHGMESLSNAKINAKIKVAFGSK